MSFFSAHGGLLKTVDQVATPLFDSFDLEEDSKGIQEYDYIIIGGGTAGCVLARRLSENPNISVLLLERGDASVPWLTTIPLISMFRTFNNSAIPYVDKWFGTWREGSVYDKSVDYSKLPPVNPSSYSHMIVPPTGTTRTSRQIPLLAGKALGGTTKINSQLYTRPFSGWKTILQTAINGWAASCGDPSWNYENMKELMKRSENNIAASAAEKEYRGQEGPWMTQKYNRFYFKPEISAAKACEAIGIPHITQSNHPNGPVSGIFDVERTMGKHGRRITTFEAFLPIDVLRKRKARLTVCTGVVASSINIRSQQGDLTAKGVFLEPVLAKKTKAKKYYVAARCEVILCAGATASPQLLMLSGVGPKKHLEKMKIPMVKDLPGVGAHLQDHASTCLVYSVPIQDSLLLLQKKPLRAMTEALKYLFFKDGLFLFPIPQCLLFTRSALLHDSQQGKGAIEVQTNASASQLDVRIPENVPDIELQSLAVLAPFFCPPIPKHRGCNTIHCLGLQPHSLGYVTLSSRNPHERPNCSLGLFTHPDDLIVMRKAVRLGLKIATTMKEQGYDIDPLWIPRSENDEDLDEFIRFEPRSNFHLSSTCRMAPEFPVLNEDDINSAGVGKTPGVVDSRLQVYGVKGLRIADASIFPTIPACHLQAPVVLVAEKCADIIKATWA